MPTPTLNLAMELIARPSITPDDAGCQEILINHLAPLNFVIERLLFDSVTNLWARRGINPPLVVFAGHTDVVPPGPIAAWTTPPFIPTIRDNYLWGRGAADMKGGLAALITATEAFISAYPNFPGSIGFLITSDEEGMAINGTRRVIQYLIANGVKIDFCLLGEPTCENQIGDCVKNGRRGSLNGKLSIKGKQGHVAYPHLARNPIHDLAPALTEILATTWDNGNAHFPPTTFQVSNLQAGTGAENVIPGELHAWFNFRFSPAVTIEQLQERFSTILARHQLNQQLDWSLSGAPFITTEGFLLNAIQAAITEVTGTPTHFSTAGGTSDGRFIAPTGAQVIEFGLLNSTIHQINERVAISDLEILHRIYYQLLQKLFNV